MANTVHRNYPLPSVTDTVAEEFFRLQQQTIVMLDSDVHALVQAIDGFDPIGGAPEIGDISGLSNALSSKMPNDRRFALSELTDVIGLIEAPDGYVPVKVGDHVVFQNAAAAVGNHGHSIAQVSGLPEKLAQVDTDLAAISTSVLRAVPAGASMAFNRATPPTGWLKENGAALSRSAYADLFAAIGTTFGAGNGTTTFNIPDSRGEFTRGWDDGRGVDGGRGFGTAQTSQNLSHSHSGQANTAGSHGHTGLAASAGAHQHSGAPRQIGVVAGWAGVGSSASGGGIDGGNLTGSAGAHTHPLTIDAAGDQVHALTINADGGAEARPRNVAKLICIKF